MKKKISILPVAVLLSLCMTSLSAQPQTPFERMDRDRDGQLTKSEFRGPDPAFHRIDRNRDGSISRLEAADTPLVGNRDQVTGSAANRAAAKGPERPQYVDTHNHLVGRRINGQYNFAQQARIALAEMDKAGVKLNLLMPMPQAVDQNLRLVFEDLLPVVKQYPDRFAALGGGGSLNVMIQQAVKEDRVTAAVEQEFDARALELVQKGALGFGEMTAEHFSMQAHHPYETAPPDHPLFLRLADLAARYDLPIDIHMEAIPQEMRMPPRFQSPPNPRFLQANIDAFRRLLAHNRQAKIIWVHLGWDNTGRRTVALTRSLLAENPNLYMSIRIASDKQKRKVVHPTFPLDEGGRLRQEWLELFQEFPDRFLIGSDEIVKPANDHPSSGSIGSTVGILTQLPVELRERIGYKNACRIYRIPEPQPEGGR